MFMLFKGMQIYMVLSKVTDRGGDGHFVFGQKCQDVDLLWGNLVRETEVQEEDLGSVVKYWSNTGKI